MAKRLSEFAVGESGTILSVSGEGAVRRRLFDMGVTPGADVKLRKRHLWAIPSRSPSAATS